MRNNTYKKIVIKVGTSTIADRGGHIDTGQISRLADQISQIKEKGLIPVLVSSGAIAVGIKEMSLTRRPASVAGLQALASIGQGKLIEKWQKEFEDHGVKIAQVLLTQYDFIHREQYLNARSAMDKLIEFGVVPIINENDITCVEEIRLGDNDILAAMVATLIDADMLIIATDISYLLDENNNPVEVVDDVTTDIIALGKGKGSELASGGMVTKLQAARIVTNSGITCKIIDGRSSSSLTDAINDKRTGTIFLPRKKKVTGRKAWIAFGRLSKGEIVVDSGARDALIEKGRSLLPAGIVNISGNFQIGDTVDIIDESGKIVGKGLTNYDSDEISKIKGMRTADISELYGDDFSEEVIHRDQLVVLSINE